MTGAVTGAVSEVGLVDGRRVESSTLVGSYAVVFVEESCSMVPGVVSPLPSPPRLIPP